MSYYYNESHPIRKGGMKLAFDLPDMINNTASALKYIQVSNNSMARVVIHKIALDFFLWEKIALVQLLIFLIVPGSRF